MCLDTLCEYKNFSEVLKNWFKPFHILLDEKYYFDKFNTWFFVNGARHLGVGLWKIGDVLLIDNLLVNGAAKLARQRKDIDAFKPG